MNWTDCISSSFSFTLTNGSYSFTIATSDKIYSPSNSSGSLTLNGSSLSKSVTFSEVLYSVTFTESGVSSGASWYVNITGSNGTTYLSGPISESSYSFSLTNGSYTYKIASSNKIYAPNLTAGSFTVNGSPLTINVNFIELMYNFTIQESGLPANTEWNLTFEGATYQLTNSSYTFSIPNGTYSFFATSHDYKDVSGTITVNGSSSVYTINMEFQLYEVTFTETGLPLGISWYVNITESNGTTYLSGPITGSTYTFSLTNGSYLFTIASANKIYSPSIISSSLTVNGNHYTESITFSLVKYTVTFTESGLLFGTGWYVNLTNGIDSGPITGSSYSFSLVNGSYSYTVQTVNKIYSPTSSSGSFTVNGTPLSKPIAFSTVTYVLTFKETGLPLGAVWYMNGSGLSGYETSHANITFNLSNGTYSFTVTNLSNYYSITTHFTVVISGKNVTEVVDYYHWAYVSGTISPTNADLVINGKSVALTSSGSFNMSVPNGTYHVVISSSGYISYYNNFSLNSGNAKNLIVSLVPISGPSVPSSTELYAIIGVVIAIAAIGAAMALVKRRK